MDKNWTTGICNKINLDIQYKKIEIKGKYK